MQKQKAKYSMSSNAAYILRLIWQQDKLLFLLLAIESVCQVGMPFFGIYLPRMALNLIAANASVYEAAAKLGALTAAMAATFFLGQYANGARYMRYNRLRTVLMADLFLSSLRCDFAYAESPQGQAHYSYVLSQLANGDFSISTRMITSIAGFAVGLLGFGAYSGILVMLHPLVVVLLIISSITVYAAMRKAADYERSKRDENGRIQRKIGYTQTVGGDVAFGKDIRLYGLKKLIVDVREKGITEIMLLSKDVTRKTFHSNCTDALLTLLRDGLAYLYLISRTLSGHISIGDFVFYFGAIAGFSAWLTSLFREYNTIHTSHHDIGRLREYLNLEAEADPDDPAPAPDPAMPHTIEFDNVSFAYEKGQPVLDGFSMRIAAGEKVALVGVNGAGKTTIVKLLCGLYRPDSGRILIDGVDIERICRRNLFAAFSTLFQDIMILPHTVAENVALRPVEEIDRARVEACLRRAGLWEDIAKRKGGIDAHLTREGEEDGYNLSGGQQQKLVLARALYKDTSTLILDEPTAALDPIAESALYEQYHALAREKTSIFISHRLASTRFCDRIVFLDNGRASETGTHEELMRAGGGYARMFNIQSHYYKQNPNGEVVAI